MVRPGGKTGYVTFHSFEKIEVKVFSNIYIFSLCFVYIYIFICQIVLLASKSTCAYVYTSNIVLNQLTVMCFLQIAHFSDIELEYKSGLSTLSPFFSHGFGNCKRSKWTQTGFASCNFLNFGNRMTQITLIYSLSDSPFSADSKNV